MVETVKWPQLILVNGPSSAGKTTICRALQAKILAPYLVVGFDDFIFMSAPRYYRGADSARQGEIDSFTALGVEMLITAEPGGRVIATAKFGPVFRRILDSMAPAVRTLVDGGNAIIFDHVLHDRAMYDSYRRAVAGLDVFTVGVTCPLEVLEARERERGDRVLGRARGLADVVHQFCDYDMKVDTAALSVEASVAAILDALTRRSRG